MRRLCLTLMWVCYLAGVAAVVGIGISVSNHTGGAAQFAPLLFLAVPGGVLFGALARIIGLLERR